MKTVQITKPAATKTAPKAAAAKTAAPKASAKKPAAKPAPVKVDPIAQMIAQADVAANIQVAEAAAQTAAKAKRTTRPAKSATAPATTKNSAVAKIAALAIKYTIQSSGRVGSGKLMEAHTQAVFEMLGMLKGAAVNTEALNKVWGGLAYHTKQGRMESNGTDTKLTTDGINHFSSRKPVQADVDAYKAMFSTGLPDGRILKNATFIKPLAV